MELSYDNLHDFCDHYKIIGHNIEVCKRIHVKEDNLEDKAIKCNVKTKRGKSKAYIQVKDGCKKVFNKEKELEPTIELVMFNKGK